MLGREVNSPGSLPSPPERPPCRPTRRLPSCLILAAACAAGGGLAVLLAHAAGGSVVVWPPIGIALAVLVARGPGLWPGVWVAAFVLALGNVRGNNESTHGLSAIVAAGLLATAYAAQAAGAAWLLRRARGQPLRLVHLREIALFLAIAGPVHTIPASVLATAAASTTNGLTWEQFASHWLQNWWADLAGGIIFAPIVLTLVGMPRALWGPRRWTVGAPLAAVGFVTAGLYLTARGWDDRSVEKELDRTATVAAALTAAEFDRLTTALDAYRCTVRPDRSASRGRGKSSGSRFLPSKGCGPARLAARPEPSRHRSQRSIRCRNPLEDWVSTWPRMPTAGPHSNEPSPRVIPSRFRLLPMGRSQADRCSCWLPVFQPARCADDAGARTAAIGFVACPVDRARLVAAGDLRVNLHTATTLSDPATAALTPAPPGGQAMTQRVVLGGWDWDLTVVVGPEFVAEHRGRFAGLVIAAGMGVGLFAAVGLLAFTARAAAVDEEVARRTAQLARQVEARMLTDAALRASEARLTEAQRIARLGYWEWDPITGTAYWCRASEDLLGTVAGTDPDGPDLLALIHPDDRPKFERIARAVGIGGGRGELDFRIVRPDGDERWVHAVLQASQADDAYLIQGTLLDVTDRVRAEAERRRFDERLQQSQKLEGLGVLAGGIAHDFNNLLTGILGNASLARELIPADGNLHDFLRPIEQAATHAASLCQQMLAYAGRGSTFHGPLLLNRLITDTADLLRLSASKKVSLRFDLAPDVPLLDGDAGQIRQVLLNLVSNASEAIGDGTGAIDIATGWGRVPCGRGATDGHRCGDLPAGTYAWVQVQDSGCGMSPDIVQKIFDPFFTTKFTGRGLGLSAVHGIAASHGGTVCVTSAPGAGTTFRVYIAIPAECVLTRTPPPSAHTPVDIGPIPRRNMPVDPAAGVAVVADDDPAVRQLAAVALQSLGFEVLRGGERGRGDRPGPRRRRSCARGRTGCGDAGAGWSGSGGGDASFPARFARDHDERVHGIRCDRRI